MNLPLNNIDIYHITDVANLPKILESGGLLPDVALSNDNQTVIGYAHIKARRKNVIQVNCCSGRYVGEFIPFYFCARSPMLFTVNKGSTGRPSGCQSSILHLVSTVEIGVSQNKDWAISNGNAGALHTVFSADILALNTLNWDSIRASQWSGKTHEKSAEFLVADFFQWSGFHLIGCHNNLVAQQVQSILSNHSHRPTVQVEPNWYY